jgi:integrase
MPEPGDRITKRKDGRYMARYTVQTPDGPKRKTIYGKAYKEVEAALAKARGDAARGLIFDAGNLTVVEWLDRWLRDAVADTVRPVTFAKYEQIVRNHAKPALGRLRLQTLTPAQCAVSTGRNWTPDSHLAPRNTSTSRSTRHSSRRSRTA